MAHSGFERAETYPNTAPLAPASSPAPTPAMAATFGFATAVAMWCVWFITHIPAIAAPPMPTALLLIATLFAGTFLAGAAGARRSLGPKSALVGAGAGLLASLVNLLILGAFLVEPPAGHTPAPGAEGLKASWMIEMAGFLAVGLVVGAVAGAIGGALTRPRPECSQEPRGAWLSRFAWLTAVAILPLLLVGGLVTSTASGMAVPGWPDSYGANMFLFPITLMSEPRVFLEHSHRLFGSMVGLTTLVFMVFTLVADKRAGIRLHVIGLFALVCVQGVLGGLRVNENSKWLAAGHGVLAQIVFILAVAAAVRLSPLVASLGQPLASRQGNRRRLFATFLLHGLILQLILGALYRHTGSMHPLFAHIGWSLIVMSAAIATGFALRAASDAPATLVHPLRRIGTALLVLAVLQFALGWAAFLVAVGSDRPKGFSPTADQLASTPQVPPLQALLPTSHQANGALVIGVAVAAYVLVRRAWVKTKAPAALG